MKNQINDPDERDRAVPSVELGEDPGDSDPTRAGPAPEPASVEEQADGSAVVKFEDEEDEGAPESKEFLENLANGVIPEGVLSRLGLDMIEDFKRDKDARSKRDEQYAEGIRRTGLGNDAPGGADFMGASRAVHPVLIEGCIEFSARSMKELFPPKGPVKTAIIGEQTEAKLDKADRKKDYMNWQLTRQIKEYRSELEQVLTQVPLGGSQYMKFWYDERFERPRVEFVPVDDMLIPFAASDFENASRKTHVQRLTRQVFRSRVDSGLYRELPALDGAPATMPDQTAAAKASDRIEGKEEDPYNEDGLREVYECYCELELEDDPLSKGELRGYILTIDESSSRVVALYRNWREKDERRCPESLAWIVEFGFVPWRGAYKIGLAHIIGGLSGALTGALRAILDGGHLQSHPGGLVMKGARASGKNVSGAPTEFTQIEAPPNVDDVRKLVMPYPYNGPSPVLFQLMDWLTTQAKGVVSTANEAIKGAGSDMPVGTALALIEQGSMTFSAVHSRLHNSQRQALEILHRINGQFLNDEETVEELGELVVSRKDFQGPMDVMPVSDPNIFSDAQRYAQNQAVLAIAEKAPQSFRIDKLVARSLRLLGYPDPDEVLSAPSPGKKIDAITENATASEPEVELKAFRGQDHLAHIKAHVHFMASPIFCANPLMATPSLPKLLAHVKEHLLMLYSEHTKAAAQSAQVLRQEGAPLPEGDSQALGAAFADKLLATQLADIMPLLEKAGAMAAQLAPKPIDPQVQKTQLEIGYKTEKDKADREADGRVAAAEAETERAAQAQAAASEQFQARLSMAEQAAEDRRQMLEMQVASQNAQLAAQSEAADRRIQLIMEHMKQDAETVRAAAANQLQLMMAEIKAGHDADLAHLQTVSAQQQAQTQQQFDLMQALLTQKNASASDAADKQIAGGSGQAESAGKKAGTRFKINRNKDGDMESFEVLQ